MVYCYRISHCSKEFIDEIKELKKYIGEIIEENNVTDNNPAKYYSFNPNKDNNQTLINILDLLEKIPPDIVLHQSTLTELYKIGYMCYMDKILEIINFLIQRGIKFCYHHLLFAYDLMDIIPEMISLNYKQQINQINEKIMQVGLCSQLSCQINNSRCYGDGCVCVDCYKDKEDNIRGTYSILERLGKDIGNFESTRDNGYPDLRGNKKELVKVTNNLYELFVEKLYGLKKLGIPFVEESKSNYPISDLKSSLVREHSWFPNHFIKICFDAVNDVCGYNKLIEQAFDKMKSNSLDKVVQDNFIEEFVTLDNIPGCEKYFECLIEFNKKSYGMEEIDKDEEVDEEVDEEDTDEFCVPISLDNLVTNIDTVYWFKKSDEFLTDYQINLVGRVRLNKETEQYTRYKKYYPDELEYLYFAVKSWYSDTKSKIFIDITPSTSLENIAKYALRDDELESIVNF